MSRTDDAIASIKQMIVAGDLKPELARAAAITHVIGLEMFLRREPHTR